jgi:2-oxo-3-(phosphooxy)propyl 3-oxoalkanoate synthase
MTLTADLSFLRTVDRTMLHRSALSEVFLTDCRPVDAERYVAGAQIPPWHAYYGDHPAASRLVDPMLLLECCRQAETYGGHAYFGVGFGTKFVLLDWSMTLTGAGLPARPGPAELAIEVTTRGHRRVGGTLRGVTYEMAMHAGDDAVGQVRIGVAYLADDVYRELRGRHRLGTPPTSTALATAGAPRWWAAGSAVPPALVGRTNPANVLLLDPVTADDGLTARVRPAVDNPSMFDHAQDHLPGMVMTDAARQAAVLALGDLNGIAPAHLTMVGMRASFSTYAELDAPTTVHARPGVDVPGADGSRGVAWEVPVAFAQGGREIAEAVLRFAVVSDGGSR